SPSPPDRRRRVARRRTRYGDDRVLADVAVADRGCDLQPPDRKEQSAALHEGLLQGARGEILFIVVFGRRRPLPRPVGLAPALGTVARPRRPLRTLVPRGRDGLRLRRSFPRLGVRRLTALGRALAGRGRGRRPGARDGASTDGASRDGAR